MKVGDIAVWRNRETELHPSMNTISKISGKKVTMKSGGVGELDYEIIRNRSNIMYAGNQQKAQDFMEVFEAYRARYQEKIKEEEMIFRNNIWKIIERYNQSNVDKPEKK